MRRARATIRPTSGRRSEMLKTLDPRVALQKAGERIEWLRFSRALELEPRDDLVRLGSAYGGYVLPEGLVGADWVCYCAGIGEDASFELELMRRYGCTVDAFDPTPRSADYARAVASKEPRFRFHGVGLWHSDEQMRFFAPRDADHVSHSIANLQHTTAFFDATCRSIPSMMAELGHDRIDLLKLDVEGAEYAVLESVRNAGIVPRLLLVDIHNTSSLDAMVQEVRRIRSMGLVPVHVHRTDVTFVASDA